MPDSPGPSATRHYEGDAGRAYHTGKRGLPPAAYPWVARLRAEKFSQHVRATDTVVEFGVGAGWNLAELKCARRIGFDVADFLAPELRARGIEFVSETAQFADASADVILCHHMLEHVLQPAASLAEMRRQASISEAQGQAWLKAMEAAFPDVKDGDRLTGRYEPGSGAQFFFNGQPRQRIDDAQFARLFFGIWLSPQTSEPALREQLLGSRDGQG